MAVLTKEYFEKILDTQLKEQDIRFDKKLKLLKDELSQEIINEIGELAAMTARRFDELERKLDVTERVERLERIVFKISEALHIKT